MGIIRSDSYEEARTLAREISELSDVLMDSFKNSESDQNTLHNELWESKGSTQASDSFTSNMASNFEPFHNLASKVAEEITNSQNVYEENDRSYGNQVSNVSDSAKKIQDVM